MDKISGKLFIGTFDEIETALNETDIECVVNLSKKDTDQEDATDIPLDNQRPSEKNLKKAVDKVISHVSDGKKTLVCCRQGVSRSVAVTAKAYSEIENESFRSSLNRIERIRPRSNPSINIVEKLSEI